MQARVAGHLWKQPILPDPELLFVLGLGCRALWRAGPSPAGTGPRWEAEAKNGRVGGIHLGRSDPHRPGLWGPGLRINPRRGGSALSVGSGMRGWRGRPRPCAHFELWRFGCLHETPFGHPRRVLWEGKEEELSGATLRPTGPPGQGLRWEERLPQGDKRRRPQRPAPPSSPVDQTAPFFQSGTSLEIPPSGARHAGTVPLQGGGKGLQTGASGHFPFLHQPLLDD